MFVAIIGIYAIDLDFLLKSGADLGKYSAWAKGEFGIAELRIGNIKSLLKAVRAELQPIYGFDWSQPASTGANSDNVMCRFDSDDDMTTSATT